MTYPRKIQIVLFSGGSGTKSITEAFLKHPQIQLSIVINAYDDGHSTGRLRRFIPGMLGPSDVRKNISRLMPLADPSFKALATISDHRLPKKFPYADGIGIVQSLAASTPERLPEPIGQLFGLLQWNQARQLGIWCNKFLEYAIIQETARSMFNFHDCALGNIFFAGCYLAEQRDFNRTVGAFASFHHAKADLFNVTQGENLFLVAVKEDGSVLRNEADIVSSQSAAKIRQIALLEESIYLGGFEDGSGTNEEAIRYIRNHQKFPKINPAVDQIVRSADVIIYGPGTQHSSLFPSYLTRGLAEAIVANTKAEKIFINNTRRDFDILDDDAGSIATRFMRCMGRYGEVSPASKDLVTHFFLQKRSEDGALTNQVPFDADSFPFKNSNLVLMDWETEEGHHVGGRVLEELQTIIQPKIEVVLESVHHMVSIIVPALNEEKTIEQVLKHLLALDLGPFNLSKEIIVADGGSTDRTAEIALSLPGIRLITAPNNCGRGAALRAGITRAKGNIVLFFPADNEYHVPDILPIVDSFLRGSFKVVFGSRAIKCVNLNERISDIYGKNWVGYMMSKYGGMLLSTITLLLYNRYVADPLTSVKAFDGRLLRSFPLRSSGVDLEMELIAKVSKREQFILEVPVDYKPRTRKAGKKTTPAEGIKALWALIRYRIAS